MKQRHQPKKETQTDQRHRPAENEQRTTDELGIYRGQNGEKGDTVRPENVVHRREAEH